MIYGNRAGSRNISESKIMQPKIDWTDEFIRSYESCPRCKVDNSSFRSTKLLGMVRMCDAHWSKYLDLIT